MISKLLAIARQEVGYLEKVNSKSLDSKTANAGTNNYTKYGAWYDKGSLQGQPWCAMLVSWCAHQAGIKADIFYPHAYCPYGVSWYQKRGLWKPRTGYTPKAGDIIYFTNNGTSAAHVGLVERVDDGKVYTIEGNTSGGSTLMSNGGGVAAKSYALSYSKILGYATPNYQEEEPEMTYEKFVEFMTQYEKEKRELLASVWAKEAWTAAKEKGLFDGTMPQAALTREQAAVVLSRME